MICETCELNRNDLLDAKMAASVPACVRRERKWESEREGEGGGDVRWGFVWTGGSSLIFYGLGVHANSRRRRPIEPDAVTITIELNVSTPLGTGPKATDEAVISRRFRIRLVELRLNQVSDLLAAEPDKNGCWHADCARAHICDTNARCTCKAESE